MKKLLFIFIALLIASMTLFGCEKQEEITEITEPYDYIGVEISQGEDYWKAYSVSEDTLKKMTTEALVKTVQNVPAGALLHMTGAYNSNDIFNNFLKNYNVLSELSSREDKAMYIDSALKEYSEDSRENWAYIQMLEFCK